MEFFLNDKCGHENNLKFNEELILFGNAKNVFSDNTFDFIVVFAKHFIYKRRLNKTIPLFNDFLNDLKLRYKIEKHIANTKMNYNNFIIGWLPYMPLIED